MSKQQQPWFYALPPDAFSRHFISNLILSKIFDNKKITILDVGGKDNPLWAMIKEARLPYNLTVIDILPANKFNKDYQYVQGDATNMDFGDNSFDCVISIDVLEHIPDSSKEQFINQCLRVAKNLIIIAAPFYSMEGDFIEHLANDFYKKISGKNHKWLSEHFKANKPKKEFLEKLLSRKKLNYTSFGSNTLENWILTILPNMLSEKVSLDKKNLESFNSYFNTNFLELNDFGDTGYRSFYIIFKDKSLHFDFKKNNATKNNSEKILTFKKMVIDLLLNEIINRGKTIKQLNELVTLKQIEIEGLSKRLQMIYNLMPFKSYQIFRGLKKLLSE